MLMRGNTSRKQKVLFKRKPMPATFLMNMSLDPAAPLSRFEVKNKNITENNSSEAIPQIFEQTINYKFKGTNLSQAEINSPDALHSKTTTNFLVDNQIEIPKVVNFQDNLEN